MSPAEIRFHPSETTHENHVAFPAPVVQEGASRAQLPSNFEVPMAWKGSTLLPNTYTLTLSQSQREEVDLALKTFKESNCHPTAISPHNFPLPKLQATLKEIAIEIHDGIGFYLIRGLNFDQYSQANSTIITLGINSYIGEMMAKQDRQGNMLIHVVLDHTSTRKVKHDRHSKTSIPYHTDTHGDILGFRTVQVAESGGNVILSSLYSIYNELAQYHSGILRSLLAPEWEFVDHENKTTKRPVIFYQDGRLIASLNFIQLPRPNQNQQEALRVFTAIADKHKIEFATRPGDLHFVNNLSLLHCRSGFEDSPETGRRRHIIRTHLRNIGLGYSIPEAMDPEEWMEAYELDGNEQWHIQPMPEEWIACTFGNF